MTKIKHQAIVVLPDGTTWSSVEGCTIRIISNAEFNKLSNDYIDACDTSAVAEIRLENIV
jgi:hypothetical protein